MSSWWWHRLFLTLLPLTRETINNYSRSRHHGENHSTRRRLKTKTDCTRKVREVAMHWPHCPFPRRAAPHGEISLSIQFFQWEKRTQAGKPAPPSKHVGHFAGAPTLISHHVDCRGICRAQPLGICDTEGEKGLQQPAWILAGQVHTYNFEKKVTDNTNRNSRKNYFSF